MSATGTEKLISSKLNAHINNQLPDLPPYHLQLLHPKVDNVFSAIVVNHSIFELPRAVGLWLVLVKHILVGVCFQLMGFGCEK